MLVLNGIIVPFLWLKVAMLSSLTLLLMACTQTNPARVEDISASAIVVNNRPAVDQKRRVVNHSTAQTMIVERPLIKTVDKKQTVATVTPLKRAETFKTTTPIRYSRDYTKLPKGEYKGASYKVKHGDTLFYIAWITGTDYRLLAERNNIKKPYELSVGQLLNVTTTLPATNHQSRLRTVASQPVRVAAKDRALSSSNVNRTPIRWYWPVPGKVIESFSPTNRGIDIGGKPGEKVRAAANGQVVYTGNALPGYGNLIIIKHSDDYLTAYAHNRTILIKEQQHVQAGDPIATMGSTGTLSTRLHFEIRYKAQSVDPIKYLPKVRG